MHTMTEILIGNCNQYALVACDASKTTVYIVANDNKNLSSPRKNERWAINTEIQRSVYAGASTKTTFRKMETTEEQKSHIHSNPLLT